MIVVKLMGGLGNQMFQYACGKALSLRLNKKMVIDKSFLLDNLSTPDVTPRNFELSVFHLPEEVIVYRKKFGLHPALPYRFNKWLNPLMERIVKTVEFTDHDSVETLVKSDPPLVILNGYFQKEKYFKQYETQIRSAFVFKPELSEPNIALEKEIKQSDSVSIHVRRGDYVNNAKTSAYHGVCSLDYYKQAIAMMQSRIPNPRFFVFSDDMDWCRENLGLSGDTMFVSHNKGSESYLDMYFMSLCKNNIIANSSFSWWSAWLNTNTNKYVIAPEKWFSAGSVDTNGLYPNEWQLL
jgi:hypothetical protein